MMGMSRDAIIALRAALYRDAGANAPAWFQEAGYAAGPGLFDAFSQWCNANGYGAPESTAVATFQQLAAHWFAELGWGTVTVSTLHESVVAIDSPDWAEADPASGMQYPGCYMSSGMLADFFGRLAGAQLVPMEVECRSMGHERCRFILGSAETIQHVYDSLGQGVAYDAALAGMA
jgi:predicted hydrocarbon binding protein